VNILFVCHRFPFPPTRGGKIRPFNIIKHLSERHRVTVASLARSAAEAAAGAGIAPYCADVEMARVSRPVQIARMVARLPTRTPSSMGFFYSRRLEVGIRERLAAERFDLIMVHCSAMAQYVAGVRGVPKILDFGDMDSQKWIDYARFKPFPLAAGYLLEGVKLRREEQRLAGMFDLCTATTRAEWQTLEHYGTGAATGWFPNGVDADYFAPAPAAYDPETICFVGRMDYYPNQECMFDFCAHTLPLIQARRPGATLSIVGADPTAAVRRLGRLPGVLVTGSVSDVRPFMQRSAVMVAPLNIARGTQNKILEAMALGVPVVTSRVAAGGVDAVADRHFLVAASHQEQADAVVQILESPAERSRLSTAGRARMQTHHSWPHSMQRLDALIEQCLSRAEPTAPNSKGAR
jgi:sugar transferase (PEP-CTERM/EpsH1 system associated)